MKRIYFVRHGQTLLNRFRRMQGWVDSPLTEKGEAQATAAGNRLADIRFQLAVSSDMLRAIHTLDRILAQNKHANGITREVHEDVCEIYFGSFEGVDSVQTWNMIARPLGYSNQEELIKHYSLLKVRDFMHDADPFHEAETAAHIEARIKSAVTRIAKELDDGENAVVVTHGTYLRNLATIYAADGKVAEQPKNGSITVLDVTHEPVVIDDIK